MNLKKFHQNEQIRNAWIAERNLKAYIRRSVRSHNTNFYDCLDLAAVEVNHNKQRKGIFRKFLYEFELIALLEQRSVFIECIHEDWFYKKLQSYGYYPCGDRNLIKYKYELPNILETKSFNQSLSRRTSNNSPTSKK